MVESINFMIKGNKSSNIIFVLWENEFSERDYQRLGINGYIQNGWDIKIIICEPFLNPNTYKLNSNYIILPNDDLYKNRYQQSGIELIPVEEGFSYNSGTNNDFLSIEQIRKLIITNIDKNFKPV